MIKQVKRSYLLPVKLLHYSVLFGPFIIDGEKLSETEKAKTVYTLKPNTHVSVLKCAHLFILLLQEKNLGFHSLIGADRHF